MTPTQNGGRVRVVHVIDSLAGSGGAENRLVDEVVALTPRFDQRVVRLFERDFFDAPLAAAGVPVTALGFRASTAGRAWPMIAYRLWRELRGDPPDVLHTSLFTGNLVGQLAGARLGVPVVSTFNRTGEIDLQRALQPGVSSWKGRTMQAIGRRVARLGDVHYRAVGDYARATNCKAMGLPLDACTAIPRGVRVDPAATEAATREPFGVPADVPLFVNVARLVPEKAQHLLVEAFARVRAKLPDAHLAIAGEVGPALPAGPGGDRPHRDGRRRVAARVPVRRPGAGGGGRRVRLQLRVRGVAGRGGRGDGARARRWPRSPSRRWPSSPRRRARLAGPARRPRRAGRRHARRLAWRPTATNGPTRRSAGRPPRTRSRRSPAASATCSRTGCARTRPAPRSRR